MMVMMMMIVVIIIIIIIMDKINTGIRESLRLDNFRL